MSKGTNIEDYISLSLVSIGIQCRAKSNLFVYTVKITGGLRLLILRQEQRKLAIVGGFGTIFTH